MLETFLRDFSQYWYDSITQLLYFVSCTSATYPLIPTVFSLSHCQYLTLGGGLLKWLSIECTHQHFYTFNCAFMLSEKKTSQQKAPFNPNTTKLYMQIRKNPFRKKGNYRLNFIFWKIGFGNSLFKSFMFCENKRQTIWSLKVGIKSHQSSVPLLVRSEWLHFSSFDFLSCFCCYFHIALCFFFYIMTHFWVCIGCKNYSHHDLELTFPKVKSN